MDCGRLGGRQLLGAGPSHYPATDTELPARSMLATIGARGL
jgi:hypothetical protein